MTGPFILQSPDLAKEWALRKSSTVGIFWTDGSRREDLFTGAAVFLGYNKEVLALKHGLSGPPCAPHGRSGTISGKRHPEIVVAADAQAPKADSHEHPWTRPSP